MTTDGNDALIDRAKKLANEYRNYGDNDVAHVLNTLLDRLQAAEKALEGSLSSGDDTDYKAWRALRDGEGET